MHLIDINDWELGCFDADGQQLYRSPCAGSHAEGTLQLGTDAFKTAKSLPQAFACHYLGRLNEEQLPNPLGNAKTQADLCFAQFLDMKAHCEVTSAAFLIPPQISDRQLSLLAGIASAAGIQPLGFIDHSLAYALAKQVEAPLHVLDMGLHQLYLSRVDIADGELIVASSTQHGIGLLSMVDSWVNVIADEFIQSSRFDPLHSAQSEQQTFDAVMGWISAGELPADLKLSIQSDQALRTATVVAERLQARLSTKLRDINLDTVDALTINQRVAQVPLLSNSLRDRVPELSTASDQALVSSALALAADLDPANLERIRGCSASAYRPAPADPSAAFSTSETVGTVPDEEAPPATHLVHLGVAYSLTDDLFREFLDADGLLRPGTPTKVDGLPAQTARLRAGQEVSLHSQRWLAIQVK